MKDDWRPQATIAVGCVAAIPLWAVVCYALDGTPVGSAIGVESALIILGLIVIVGIGCAIAGSVRGSHASRTTSKVCLFLWALMIVGLCVTFRVVFPPGTRFA
jgi:hypothetical protein